MIILGPHAAFEFNAQDVIVQKVDAAYNIWIPDLTLAAYGDPGEAYQDVLSALGDAVCQLWCYGVCGVCGVLDWNWEKQPEPPDYRRPFIERTDLELDLAITLCQRLREVRLGSSLRQEDHLPGLLHADGLKLKQLEQQLESQRELRGVFGLNAGKLRWDKDED